MNEQECVKVLEGLIFASDTPLALQKIQEILEPNGLDRQAVKKGIADLAKWLEETGSALQVVEMAGGYRLVTRKELGPWIRKLSRPKKVRLSPAALEVLAIIAYKQPVTTPEVEAIRGVNSSGVIKTLLERALIKVAGRMDAVGNPIMYATTREFLEYFGLRSLKDLPTLKEFQEILEEHEAAAEAETTAEAETEETSTDAEPNLQQGALEHGETPETEEEKVEEEQT
ncbi:MAG: SMC-Scp complex subunit ScpB [bacterium]|nr:SMC-Scp complex subunit ScpB [bacterium]